MTRIAFAVDELSFWETYLRCLSKEEYAVSMINRFPELLDLINNGKVDLIVMTVPQNLHEASNEWGVRTGGGLYTGWVLADYLEAQGLKTPIILFDTGVRRPIWTDAINATLFDPNQYRPLEAFLELIKQKVC